MSFDIPASIEVGLERMLPSSVSPNDLPGAFSSLGESLAADEALELAMKDRERRNAQVPMCESLLDSDILS